MGQDPFLRLRYVCHLHMSSLWPFYGASASVINFTLGLCSLLPIKAIEGDFMSKNKGSHAAGQGNPEGLSSGGFVPATLESSKKTDPAAGQPIVNGTYGQYTRGNQHYKTAGAATLSSGKKKAIVAVVVVALVAAIGGLAFYLYKETQKQTVNADLHQLAASELKAVDEELTGHTQFDEPFTVLLLGSDARSDDPDMGARTDTIILVRVDPTVNKVSMVSIPRDTRIQIEGQGYQKFNAAYTYGGPSGTIAAVKELTGVDIDHYAEINFEGLVGLVDAIGGIDVVVDEEINDEDAGGHIDAGEQHLDGEHALILARSRAYVDGDYTRQVNQRKVIMAIINKALTAPATELSGLIQASTKFLKTDSGIDFDFIYDLADQIRHNNDYEVTIYTATLPSSTAEIDGVSWVIADTDGVKEMMKLFEAGKDVSKGVSKTSIVEDVAAAKGTSATGDQVMDEAAVGVTYYEEATEDGGYYEESYYEESENYEGNLETESTGDEGDSGEGGSGSEGESGEGDSDDSGDSGNEGDSGDAGDSSNAEESSEEGNNSEEE